MLNPEGNRKITSVQYYDGLGRVTQNVQNGVNATSSQTNYIQQEYDAEGRSYRLWLPIPGMTLSYNSILTSLATDPVAYSQTSYDVINRVVFVSTPGSDMVGRGKATEYTTNSANSVKRYRATDSGLSQDGYYPAGTLSGVKITDEDGRTYEIYKDMLGSVVLERRATNNNTYYVYDNLHQLRFVLSPQYQYSGYKAIYGYEYRYDNRGNVVKKILPQCEYIQYWYDQADRLTFMQDANLRSKGLYRFFLYDSVGRLTIQGLSTTAKRSHNGVDYVPVTSFVPTTSGISGTGYVVNVQGLVDSNSIIEITNYYDNYDFFSAASLSNFSFASASVQNVQGLKTGTIIKASNGSSLYSVMYYNERGLLTETKTAGLDNTIESSMTQYTFSNKPEESTFSLMRGNLLLFDATATNTYGNTFDKLREANLSVTSGMVSADVCVGSFLYDNIGRINRINRTSNAGAIEYEYDVRGWMTSITTKDFSEELFYADNQLGSPLYNGDISALRWKDAGYKPDHQNMKYRGYTFTYDDLNRLTTAVYGEGPNLSTNKNRYNESVERYDDNGNIQELSRRGLKQNGIYGTIDNLTIHLDGNQIKEVKDVAERVTRPGTLDFDNGNNGDWYQYQYNECGALVSDANRGIALIEYDDNNYPQRVQFTNGNVTKYVYTSTGIKLRTVHYTAVPNITVPIGTKRILTLGPNGDVLSADTTDYHSGLLLTNGQPSIYLYDGGYCSLRSPSGNQAISFHYYNRDHQGNIRVVVNATTGSVEQVTNYYPFGTVYSDSTTHNPGFQKFKYNGKELDLTHGLNTYDYGARNYDPLLCRFTQIDPLCEKYYSINPYAYCGNNPVNAIDPNGKEIWIHYTDIDGLKQSFQYCVGMKCNIDNADAQTIVSNLNEMYANEDGAIVLDALLGSDIRYGYMKADTYSEGGEGYYDYKTNTTNLNDVNNTLTFAEETFHMYQRVNNQGGKTDVNEVEAKLFSAKINLEIKAWNNMPYHDKIAGKVGSPYADSMANLLWTGYNDKDYKIAVDNFFSGSISGSVYKKQMGYVHGTIRKNPLIKKFLPTK